MNTSRREFFVKTLGSAAALVLAPQLVQSLFSSKALAADACKPVVPGQGMAASVNYAEDKKKVKKELQIDRNGTPFAKQDCSNCALYVADASGKFGKCALFATECVKPTSWCASWNKKA
jgi:hypothetical protein